MKDFPDSYGIDSMGLLTVNPRMIFAYWEIGKEKLEKIKKDLEEKDSSLILRVLDERKMPITSQRIGKTSIGSFYFNSSHGISPDKKYLAQLGLMNSNGYYKILDSNETATPRESESHDNSYEEYDPKKDSISSSEIKGQGKGLRKIISGMLCEIKNNLSKDSDDRLGNYSR